MGGRGWSAVRSAVHRRDDIQQIIARTTPLQIILEKPVTPAWRSSWKEKEAYRREVVSVLLPSLFSIARAVLVSQIAFTSREILEDEGVFTANKEKKDAENDALWIRWEEIVDRLSSYRWDYNPLIDLEKETLGGLTIFEFLETVAKDTTVKYHLDSVSASEGVEFAIPVAESLQAIKRGENRVYA